MEFMTNHFRDYYLKRSRAPDKLACQGRRERLQQTAVPPSSAHFVRYAVAFYIAAYGSARSLLRRAEPIQEFPAVYRAEILQLSRVKYAEPIQKLPGFSRLQFFS